MKHFKHTFYDFGLIVAIAGVTLAVVGIVSEFYL
jgi:hypothetical protein